MPATDYLNYFTCGTREFKMVKITIDEREYEAEEGLSVLEVARANQISIPTLCYHPALKPSGSCRLCALKLKK